MGVGPLVGDEHLPGRDGFTVDLFRDCSDGVAIVTPDAVEDRTRRPGDTDGGVLLAVDGIPDRRVAGFSGRKDRVVIDTAVGPPPILFAVRDALVGPLSEGGPCADGRERADPSAPEPRVAER
jgi:hypothetical protein